MNKTSNANAGAVTITIPLQVTISLGAASVVAGFVARERTGASLAVATEAAEQFSVESLAATQFTWRTALSLAMASNLAYSPRGIVESTATAWGLSGCRFIEAADTQCFVASTPEVALVAFRGTESVRDWLADLNALRVTRPYGRVHRGFYHAFNDVRSLIESMLSGPASRRIVLTGHSLGGALATVAAAEWFSAGDFQPATIYTYGQPRVGDNSFRNFLNLKIGERFSRFVNDDDIVPRVPPGFRHVGKVFHFDEDGNLQDSEEAFAGSALEAAAPDTASTEPPPLTEAEFDQLRAQLLAARQGSRLEAMPESAIATPQLEGLLPSFRDHALDNYIRKILLHLD